MSTDPVDRPILLIDEIASPLGRIVIAARDGRLCAVEFGRAAMARRLARRCPGWPRRRVRDPFGISSSIRAYLAGDLTAVDRIAVDTGGTAFQRRVWRALRAIRVGRTMSYAALARAIGHTAAVRAVGAANGSNPISIVVPCHRLIGGDGSLTGYGGGLWRKRWLLDHEGAASRFARPATPRGERRTGRSRSPR
ncbi:MAG TPA: methylated-DNA--[protein]-cysteine S-methyltransferase [Methylomirabilota bacterium]|jgi:methylated-DNA-[protein]-cysteine S-methyltransferase